MARLNGTAAREMGPGQTGSVRRRSGQGGQIQVVQDKPIQCRPAGSGRPTGQHKQVGSVRDSPWRCGKIADARDGAVKSGWHRQPRVVRLAGRLEATQSD